MPRSSQSRALFLFPGCAGGDAADARARQPAGRGAGPTRRRAAVAAAARANSGRPTRRAACPPNRRSRPALHATMPAKTITLAECQEHMSDKDCWLVIEGKVRPPGAAGSCVFGRLSSGGGCCRCSPCSAWPLPFCCCCCKQRSCRLCAALPPPPPRACTAPAARCQPARAASYSAAGGWWVAQVAGWLCFTVVLESSPPCVARCTT